MSDQLLIRHSMVFNQRMTFLRASRLSFAPFFGATNENQSDIFVILEEESVTAGQLIHGNIFITLTSKLTECELIITSTGLEELKVYQSFRLTSEKTSKVYSFSTKVRNWSEMLTGSYKIPFSLKIPHRCPSTFYFSDEDQEKNYIKCSISYLFSVSLVCKETELSYNLHLTVKSSESLSIQEEVSKHVSLNSCCFFSSGATSFIIQPQGKDPSSINGKFTYKLLSNNSNSSKAIVRICSQIVRTLRFASARQEFKSKNILSKIQRTVNIQPRAGRVDDPDFVFVHDLLMGREDFNTSSATGKLVKSNFFLEIFVYYEGKMNGTPAAIVHEIFVNPEPVVKDKISEPLLFNEEPPFSLLIED
jgi:hypothetical protein